MYKRSIFLLLLIWTVAFSAFAQIPEGINYQAVVRDGEGAVLSNKAVNFRFSVLRIVTNNIIYREIQTTETNEFGLVNLVIGSGLPVTGTFQDINWENGGLKLRVELDPQGGNFFELFGESDFQSVPFALGAETANSLSIAARISTGQILASGAQQGQVLRWNGTAWVPSNETGASTIATTSRLSGNGTTASPLDIARQGATQGQILKWNGSSWAPANETSVQYNPGVGIQIIDNTISATPNASLWNASQLRGTNVSTNSPNSGQILRFDGNSWAPANIQTGIQLPYDGINEDALTPAFRITNNAGAGINGRGMVGVRATATGSPPNSVALELQNGGLRVSGVNRPAFRVSGSSGLININNPLSNNSPNALLFVTQLVPNPSDNPQTYPFAVAYDFTLQQWVIVSEPGVSLTYNVLIINQ